MRITRAFILAAGFGTRLKPLSEAVPKPLWPLFDVPIGAHLIRSLAIAGVGEFIVNLHHLPALMEEGLAPWFDRGALVHWSREERILGTGGALLPWAERLSEVPFFLANADTYRGFDPAGMAARFSESGGAACLSLVRLPPGCEGPIGVDGEGRIVSFLGSIAPGCGEAVAWCDFTGMHILTAEVLREVSRVGATRDFFCINADIHAVLVARGTPLYGYLPQDAHFCDLGTPESYLGAHFDFLSAGNLPSSVGGTLWREDGCTREGGEVLAPSWLGEGASVGRGAVAGPFAVIGSGARLAGGARVSRSVVWPGVEVSGEVVGTALAPQGFVRISHDGGRLP